MIGLLSIDGLDAYREFGIFVAKDSYKDLVEYPPLKRLKSNEWAEEHGEEVDLSSPVLDTREVTINFVAHGTASNIDALIATLVDGAYHDFQFHKIGRTYRLRLVSQSNLKKAQRIGQFALRFASDFPLDGYTYQAPLSTIAPRLGYRIDGVDLSRYGVYILDGSREEVEKMPATKKNLLRNIESQAGAIYDGEMVRFTAKEVKLSCLMRAATLAEFWRNYNALLFDLIRPEERSLYVDSKGIEYPCYYKSCSVEEFYATTKVWFKFDITLVFTSFRVNGEKQFLQR